jgi:SAM-dependent methyltransferase
MQLESDRFPDESFHSRFKAIVNAMPSNAKVLDVACGSGTLMAALHAKGCSVVGIDIAPGAVEVARSKGLKDVHLGDVDTFASDERIRRIMLADYDAMVFSKALAHLREKNSLFSHLRTKRIFIIQRNPRYWLGFLPRYRPSKNLPYVTAQGKAVPYTMGGLREWAKSYDYEMDVLSGGLLRGRNMVVMLTKMD